MFRNKEVLKNSVDSVPPLSTLWPPPPTHQAAEERGGLDVGGLGVPGVQLVRRSAQGVPALVHFLQEEKTLGLGGLGHHRPHNGLLKSQECAVIVFL